MLHFIEILFLVFFFSEMLKYTIDRGQETRHFKEFISLFRKASFPDNSEEVYL